VHRLVHGVTRAVQIINQLLANLRQVAADVIFVDEIGGALQLLRSMWLFGVQNPVLYFTIVNNEDGQHTIVR